MDLLNDIRLSDICVNLLREINIPSFNLGDFEKHIKEFSHVPTLEEKRICSVRCIEDAIFPYSKYFLDKPHRSVIHSNHLKEVLTTLKNVEDIVLKLDLNYREHFTHQLRVCLTGFAIINANREVWIEATKEFEINIFSRIFAPYFRGTEEAEEVEKIIRQIFDSFIGIELSNAPIFNGLWILTSLVHDAGYPPVNFLKIINYKLREMYSGLLSYYKFQSFELIPRECYDKQMDEMLESITVVYSEVPEMVTFLDLMRSGSEPDHGLIGACLLFPARIVQDVLRDIEEIKTEIENKGDLILDLVAGFYAPLFGEPIPPPARKMYETMSRLLRNILYLQTLICVSLHNKPYFFALSPLLQLLVVSDNLQEWGREKDHQIESIQMAYNNGNLTLTIAYADKEPAEKYYKKLAEIFDCFNDTLFKKVAESYGEPYIDFQRKLWNKIPKSLKVNVKFTVLYRENSNFVSTGELFLCSKCGMASKSEKCLNCQESNS